MLEPIMKHTPLLNAASSSERFALQQYSLHRPLTELWIVPVNLIIPTSQVEGPVILAPFTIIRHSGHSVTLTINIWRRKPIPTCLDLYRPDIRRLVLACEVAEKLLQVLVIKSVGIEEYPNLAGRFVCRVVSNDELKVEIKIAIRIC